MQAHCPINFSLNQGTEKKKKKSFTTALTLQKDNVQHLEPNLEHCCFFFHDTQNCRKEKAKLFH